MKHKHYDMIVAKAENMELTTLVKFGETWMISAPHTVGEVISFVSLYEYFLCLPQHKEACLHWLNGGESQYLSNGMEKWINFGDSTRWSDTHLFMTTECELRIKPKKEKRWVLECNGTFVTTRIFTSEGAAKLWIEEFDRADEGIAVIEIEIEVKD